MQAVRDQVLFLPPCPLLTVCVPGSRLSCAQARRQRRSDLGQTSRDSGPLVVSEKARFCRARAKGSLASTFTGSSMAWNDVRPLWLIHGLIHSLFHGRRQLSQVLHIAGSED